jgi:hypothetical protein
MWLILPIPIDLPDEISVKIQAENISLSGLMLTATQEEFEAMLHRKNTEGVNVQPKLHATFTLPRKNAKDLTIDASCRAIHVRRASQNKYHIGLKFLQLNQAAASAIQLHIQSHL